MRCGCGGSPASRDHAHGARAGEHTRLRARARASLQQRHLDLPQGRRSAPHDAVLTERSGLADGATGLGDDARTEAGEQGRDKEELTVSTHGGTVAHTTPHPRGGTRSTPATISQLRYLSGPVAAFTCANRPFTLHLPTGIALVRHPTLEGTDPDER